MKVELATIPRFLAAWTGIKPTPTILEFEITHLCNLKCQYCDRHERLPNEMSLAQIFSVLEQFYELGMRYVGLDGGEPLVHRHFAEIVDWLDEHHIVFHLNTNGILVPRMLDSVRKARQVKISLDGEQQYHDAMRGEGSFSKAFAGAIAAREAGVPVELRCVLGSHNVHAVDGLLEFVSQANNDLSIMFQPARSSLFAGVKRDGSAWMVSHEKLMAAFRRIEQLKRDGAPVANRWGSLRHFRKFPQNVEIPCASGWIKATMEPDGSLYHCAMIKRKSPRPNAVVLGAREAFARLERWGCRQCWCGRAVEGNLAWGGRFGKLLMPLR